MIQSLTPHKYLIWMIPVLFLALSQMSCGHDDRCVKPDDDTLSGIVSFSILTPRISRAGNAWGDPEDHLDRESENFENQLILDQIHVVVTDMECSREVELNDLVFSKVSEDALYVKYECVGRLSGNSLDFVRGLNEGKLHIMANAGYSARLTNDPTFIRYGCREDFPAIPMWGVLKTDFSGLSSTSALNIQEPLTLLRAMAKIEIGLSDKENNGITKLKTVTVSSINPKGCLLPHDWDKYDDTKKIDRAAQVRVPDDQPQYGPLSFSFSDDNFIEFYLPEVLNTGTKDENEIKLTIVYETQLGERTGDLYFRNYISGRLPENSTFYDVQRNYVYRYTVFSDPELEVLVDIQPFAEQVLNFGFGLIRDSEGDLMVVPTPERDEAGNLVYDENGKVIYTYPKYFTDFINDSNPNHKYPTEEDEDGNPTTGLEIELTDGDYYAIVVGEDEEMSKAVVWVKDKDGCRVLSNYGMMDNTQDCRSRLVQAFFGNNQSEKFHKDIFGYRRVYHFDNHNSIVRHPVDDSLLLCIITISEEIIQTRKYYEVESWDESSHTGWIINRDDDGNEVGFQEITSDGTLGEAIDMDGKPIAATE